VNQKTKQDLASQYSFRGLDPKLLDRVSVIENSTEIPPHYPLKEMRRTLRILYMGRGAKVKRVHIIFQVAAKCHELKVPAKFIFVGSNLEDQAICRENCILVGEIIDPAEKMKYYEDADLLMLSSSREGFPLVVMEAMAHGVLPVCTKVGGIPEHVIPGVTGILIEAQEEEKIVNALLNSVLELEQNRKLLRKMSKAAYERAVKHFDRRNFRAAYRTLFLMDNCRQDIMRLE
jgi:glycosyltransferase involved in cell wall biosynthesis